ncbi:MAG: hypothetical protein P4L33_22235 [Capsulimonadaceae bacterium]|nr:hypothetical protein [Capsulimonadaceae bacterium]
MSLESFYSLTNSTDYILTADSSEASTLLTEGYSYWYSPTSNIYSASTDYTGLVALYRASNPSTGSNYYTTTASVITTLVSKGWTNRGTAGYVLPATASMPSGWGALHIAENTSDGVYLFTASPTAFASLGSAWNKSSNAVCWVPNPSA